ncbi:MAG: immunoglobulin domain-containing protein [Verrucomicrobia bacterium]|nr:immunoglobulin domain-containing protein [Verrucomicrobiota bacterium]
MRARARRTRGATTYTIASAGAADAGSYDCVASNSAGSATSSAAVLSVNAQIVAPSISTQPQGVTVTEGTDVILSVTVIGSAPLVYQWWVNSTLLASQTSSQLTLNNVTTNQTGNYYVQVTNAAGGAKSSIALVTVTSAPALPPSPAVLAPTVQNGELVLRFTAAIGKPHALECTDDLLTAKWIVLTNFPPAASTNLVAYDSLTNGPQRFYRVLTGP